MMSGPAATTPTTPAPASAAQPITNPQLPPTPLVSMILPIPALVPIPPGPVMPLLAPIPPLVPVPGQPPTPEQVNESRPKNGPPLPPPAYLSADGIWARVHLLPDHQAATRMRMTFLQRRILSPTKNGLRMNGMLRISNGQIHSGKNTLMRQDKKGGRYIR